MIWSFVAHLFKIIVKLTFFGGIMELSEVVSLQQACIYKYEGLHCYIICIKKKVVGFYCFYA